MTASITGWIALAALMISLRQSQQVAVHRMAAERTDRYLLANTMCEHLDAKVCDEARARLIDTIVNAPVLTAGGPVGSVVYDDRTEDGARNASDAEERPK